SGWIKQSCEYAVKTGSGENDKKLVSRTLSEGLGLSGEDDKYVIFREVRSNLWYIRKSKDICEQGMFIALNGFETQIFMDIRQEKDASGSLKELCEFLNGRGTQDLHTAWQDLHYKKLYQAFQNIVSSELCSNLGTLKMTTKELKASNLKKATSSQIKQLVAEPIEAFYEIANDFAEEEFLAEQKTESLEPETKSKKAKQVVKFKKIAAPKNLTIPKGSKVSLKDIYLYLYNIVAPLAEAGFAKKWSLDRKIAEFTANTTIGDMQSYDFFHRAFILSSGLTLKLTETSEKEDLAAIVEKLAVSKDSWDLIGANDFNGTKWFNKERMESTLALYKEILSNKATEAKLEIIESIFKKLNSAQKKSEYKCQEFIAPFQMKAKKVTKTKETKSTKAVKTDK
ncbi:MAG: alpha-amylase, partial [Treponema sp.]|nr:alpha-amylase [Treponema sp.]